MEGLLIAEELRRLRRLLPSDRRGWRFPDAHTFVLPLAGSSLWLFNRPPHPRIELRDQAAPSGRTHSGFQDLLAARAAGDLEEARQRKLDRVLSLDFKGASGFVETPPVTLVAELTGRNCNLILLDEAGLVLGAAREIHSDVNRFRQVVAGQPYRLPPPYEKVDPRSAGRDRLAEVMTAVPLRSLRRIVDGVGPELTRALVQMTKVPDDRPLQGADLELVLAALDDLAREPSRLVREALRLPDVATVRERERRGRLIERLRHEIGRELALVEKRLGDLGRARAAAGEAEELRQRGDLLLAYAHAVPEGAAEVSLEDFSGSPVTLTLDPSKGAAANAQSYYERARKREARARQADLREPELRTREEELRGLLDTLPEALEADLATLSSELLPVSRSPRKSGPGVRYRAPHGYTVVVGRNSRENDLVTFKVARSRDVWLHVQGYQGAHVVVQAENREVPFDTILFAARLAAGYSKAADSDNVPVDYTLRKNVWKIKGQSAGAVNFAHQKTVYVTPSRRPGEAE